MPHNATGLELIRKLVRAGSYKFSGKVLQYLNAAQYALQDVFQCIYTGEIHKREKDDLDEA